jgi:hypothetical protein
MAAEGVQNTLGPVSDDYRAGLAAYFAGEKSTAVGDFEKVLSVVPSHQFAQEYLQKAQALPDSGGIPVWVWIVLGLVLVALAVLVIAIVATRRRARGAPAETMPTAPTTAAATTPPPPPVAPTGEVPAPTAAAPAPEPTQQPPATEEPDLFCPHCGTKHEADAQFCGHCGRPLT